MKAAAVFILITVMSISFPSIIHAKQDIKGIPEEVIMSTVLSYDSH